MSLDEKIGGIMPGLPEGMIPVPKLRQSIEELKERTGEALLGEKKAHIEMIINEVFGKGLI